MSWSPRRPWRSLAGYRLKPLEQYKVAAVAVEEEADRRRRERRWRRRPGDSAAPAANTAETRTTSSCFTAADAITAEAHDRCKATRFESSVDDVAAVVLFLCEPPATEAGGRSRSGRGERGGFSGFFSPSSSAPVLAAAAARSRQASPTCDAANSRGQTGEGPERAGPPGRLFEEHVALGRAVGGVISHVGSSGRSKTAAAAAAADSASASAAAVPAPPSSTHGSDFFLRWPGRERLPPRGAQAAAA